VHLYRLSTIKKYPMIASAPFTPTRQSGLDRLTQFAAHMGRDYAAARNYDYGQDDRSNVSALSAHVRHRLVLERELAATALEHHSLRSAEKFVQEVFWRTYWKGWLEMRPRVWRDYCAARSDGFNQLSRDKALSAAYANAINGKTGIACFDAWADELASVGYLHNHSRMWYASIWIYTLNLPWALGADHFLRHLVDGDAASNTLSWRWVGGLQTRGKTYLARASNINKYTANRFEMQGYDLASEAEPLPWDDPPGAQPLELAQDSPSGPYTLFLHEEDCAPEALALPHPPERIVVQASPVARGSEPLSDTAQQFTQGALNDLAVRAESMTPNVKRMSVEEIGEAASKGKWVMPYVPIGPLSDALSGAHLATIVREEDALLWPYATKGFFKFKDAIPGALQTLGFGV